MKFCTRAGEERRCTLTVANLWVWLLQLIKKHNLNALWYSYCNYFYDCFPIEKHVMRWKWCMYCNLISDIINQIFVQHSSFTHVYSHSVMWSPYIHCYSSFRMTFKLCFLISCNNLTQRFATVSVHQNTDRGPISSPPRRAYRTWNYLCENLGYFNFNFFFKNFESEKKIILVLI